MASAPSFLFLLTTLLLLCNFTPSTSSSLPLTPSPPSSLPLTPSPPSSLPLTPSPPSSLPLTPSPPSLLPSTPSLLPLMPSPPSSLPLMPSTPSSFPSPPSMLPLLPSSPSTVLPPSSSSSRVEDFVVDPLFSDFGAFYSALSFPARGGDHVTSASALTSSEPAESEEITAGKRFTNSDVLALLLTYGLGALTAVLIFVLIWALCMRRAPAGGAEVIAGVARLAVAAGPETVVAGINRIGEVVRDAAEGGFLWRCARRVSQAVVGTVGVIVAIGRTRMGRPLEQPLMAEPDLEAAGEPHREEEEEARVENEIEPAPNGGDDIEQANGGQNEPIVQENPPEPAVGQGNPPQIPLIRSKL